MKISEREIELRYYDVGRRRKMTPRAILKYFSEISAAHNDLNNGKELEAKGYGWMINKWRVGVEKYPSLYDRVIIKTWISNIDRFFVTREFAIESLSGEILVKATTLWIFIDMEKRRPARLNEDLIDYGLVVDKNFFTSYTRTGKDLDLENEMDFRVRRMDIDTNQHVNNLVYFDWMLENVIEEIYEDYEIKELEIDYKKEVTYPAVITARDNGNIDLLGGNTINLTHGIYNEDQDLRVVGLTSWRKKNSL